MKGMKDMKNLDGINKINAIGSEDWADDGLKRRYIS
jgi:hypothetical protein